MAENSIQELRRVANIEKTPGSDTALDEGCLCPVLDNAHGIGYMSVWGKWVMVENCPLHGAKEQEREKQ